MAWYAVFLVAMAVGRAVAARRQRPGFVRGAAWGMALGHVVAVVVVVGGLGS